MLFPEEFRCKKQKEALLEIGGLDKAWLLQHMLAYKQQRYLFQQQLAAPVLHNCVPLAPCSRRPWSKSLVDYIQLLAGPAPASRLSTLRRHHPMK